jgi:hypothetical protein
MTVEGSHRSIAKRPAGYQKARSSLVRRLVEARDDPAKQRIRRWLGDIDDERLANFGLTPEDIALLRGSGNSVTLDHGSRRFRPGDTTSPDIAVSAPPRCHDAAPARDRRGRARQRQLHVQRVR